MENNDLNKKIRIKNTGNIKLILFDTLKYLNNSPRKPSSSKELFKRNSFVSGIINEKPIDSKAAAIIEKNKTIKTCFLYSDIKNIIKDKFLPIRDNLKN
jgi:hypothetical protein